MGVLTERTGEGLEGLSKKFGNRLHGWLVSAGSIAGEAFMNIMAKSAAKDLAPLIEKVRSQGNLPPEVDGLFKEIQNPTGEFATMLGVRAGGAVVSGVIDRFAGLLLRPVSVALSHIPDATVPELEAAIGMWRRHLINTETLHNIAETYGVGQFLLDLIIKLGELRFPSDLALPLIHRDKNKWSFLKDDVTSLGVDEKHLEALEELYWKVPGAGDVIRYAVREAYTPEIYKKFGQDQDFPTEALGDAEAAGIKEDRLRKEWISHWDLPGVAQGYEMYHRGIITLDELKVLLRARDVMPYWRDKLIDIAWDFPNRIELRMMARYGIVDKAYLVKVFEKIGVAEEYRSTIADMNIAVGILTDLRTRYANGYINSDQVKQELADAQLAPEVQTRLYQYIIKVDKPARTSADKDLTKAELIKGVTQGVLMWEDVVGALTEMGYDEEEANYILAINVPQETGLPVDELRNRIDTVRRSRRQRLISRDEEVVELLQLGLVASLANSYADNDDLRLAKEAVARAPEVIPEYQTDDGKVKVETIRLRRRQRLISRAEEITSLVELEMSTELAVAYADNDDLRLIKVAG